MKILILGGRGQKEGGCTNKEFNEQSPTAALEYRFEESVAEGPKAHCCVAIHWPIKSRDRLRAILGAPFKYFLGSLGSLWWVIVRAAEATKTKDRAFLFL